MEKWNLYNRNGELTDLIHLRGKPVPMGYYHMVVHIWFKDERGRFLIQQRAHSLSSHPGIWAATGGSALVGESSIEAVQRETNEELGLVVEPQNLHLVNRFWRSNHFVDLWLTEIHAGFVHEFRPTSEVDAVDFCDTDTIASMIESGTFFRYKDDIFAAMNVPLKRRE